jgi:hypothetical protein
MVGSFGTKQRLWVEITSRQSIDLRWISNYGLYVQYFTVVCYPVILDSETETKNMYIRMYLLHSAAMKTF